jgi:hypothetical protein
MGACRPVFRGGFCTEGATGGSLVTAEALVPMSTRALAGGGEALAGGGGAVVSF